MPACLERRNFLGVSLSHERARFWQKKSRRNICTRWWSEFPLLFIIQPVINGRMLFCRVHIHGGARHSGLLGWWPGKLLKMDAGIAASGRHSFSKIQSKHALDPSKTNPNDMPSILDVSAILGVRWLFISCYHYIKISNSLDSRRCHKYNNVCILLHYR